MAKKTNLKSRYYLLSLICIFVCLGILSIILSVFMDDMFMYFEKRSMKSISQQISSIDLESSYDLAFLSDIESNEDVYIEIYSPVDVLIYNSKSNYAVFDKTEQPDRDTLLQPRIMKILSHTPLEDGGFFEIRQEYFATAQYIVYGTFIDENTQVEIYSSLDVIRSNARIAAYSVFIVSLFVFLIIFVIFLIYGNMIIKPLRQINRITERMTRLNFEQSCPSFKINELDELSENINSLSERLDRSLDELKNKNIKLESDIQYERRLEKSRQTFIANLSHELKTPISIISGYAEGMKYGIGCSSSDEFCDIVLEESDKMNKLIMRIMEQLQYSSMNFKLNLSEFSLRELIDNLLKNKAQLIEEASAKVILDIPSELTAYADPELIAHVFDNYFSNALAHLDFERKIIISAKEKNGLINVTVFNSGKNIPGEDIESIWQSFYRADKSHSRQQGRFGLGLSIVVTIQQLHGCGYGVKNKSGGVEFSFEVKKAK